MEINVHDIIKAWLIEHGYDGLAGEDCGCGVNDLFAGECPHDCIPAYWVDCTEERCRTCDRKEWSSCDGDWANCKGIYTPREG